MPHSILTQLAWPLSNAQQGDASFLAYKHVCFFLQKETEICTVLWAFTDHFAKPACSSGAGNVFGVVPNNAARDVSIILMVIHEVCLSLCVAWYCVNHYQRTKTHLDTQKGPLYRLTKGCLRLQCIAYAIYITPVFFMWEKLIGTHYKTNWIRLPSRLPVGTSLPIAVKP